MLFRSKQERPALRDIVVLDPTWLTGKIAAVVRDPEVRVREGRLLRSDLPRIWGPLQRHITDHLVQLMDVFDLTYSTGDSEETGIVVEALQYKDASANVNIHEPNQPHIEMIYRFPQLQRRLPPGVPTWAFARAHRFLSKQQPLWRDAAVFEDAHTRSRAVIVSSDSKREVRLKVSADWPSFFFGQMQDILFQTFERYRGLKPERRFPCNCSPDCPHSFDHDTVMAAARDGDPLRCEAGKRERVNPQALLSGVEHKSNTESGVAAMHAEMRREFTQLSRTQNDLLEKTCPSVFTLQPSKGFTQLETWIEAATQEDQLDLWLHCEHDSGWHAPQYALYRFAPQQKWFEGVKKNWSVFASVTKKVAPLVPGLAGTEFIVDIVKVDAPSPHRKLTRELGERETASLIDLDARHLLEQIIKFEDAKDTLRQPFGGLHRCKVEDGRVLWLCGDHYNKYRERELAQ